MAAGQTTNINDSSLTGGSAPVIHGNNNSVLYTMTDAGAVNNALTFAAGANQNAFDFGTDVATQSIDNSLASSKLLAQTLADKEKFTDGLVSGFKDLAKDTQTTLRDTLSTALKSPALAGPADASGGAPTWISKNPVLSAVIGIAVLIFFGLTLRSRKSA